MRTTITLVALLAAVLAAPPARAGGDWNDGSVAWRGYEDGLLPPPARGDFRAYGRSYRHLTPAEQSEAHSLAAERHHALVWLTTPRESWGEAALDT